jgi:hypothetical protein
MTREQAQEILLLQRPGAIPTRPKHCGSPKSIRS